MSLDKSPFSQTPTLLVLILSPPPAGDFMMRVFQLVPHGLVGDYYDDAYFQSFAFSR